MLDDVGLVHVVLNDCHEVDDASVPDDIVPVVDTVAGDVANGPDCLLNSTHILTPK